MIEVLGLALFTALIVTFSCAAIGGNYLRHRLEENPSLPVRSDAADSAPSDLVLGGSMHAESARAA